jgi:5-methylcytosine-specific restriction endonuclease McrA
VKEKILKLREEGKTYSEIILLLGCSRGLVSYYCGIGQKEKTRNRNKKTHKKHGCLYRKLIGFCFDYSSRSTRKSQLGSKLIDISKVKEKIGDRPSCYITGTPIDLEDMSSYSLDHIIPLSKGGKSTIENLGLTTRQANMCKSSLSYDELLKFCENVLIHAGYEVKQIN